MFTPSRGCEPYEQRQRTVSQNQPNCRKNHQVTRPERKKSGQRGANKQARLGPNKSGVKTEQGTARPVVVVMELTRSITCLDRPWLAPDQCQPSTLDSRLSLLPKRASSIPAAAAATVSTPATAPPHDLEAPAPTTTDTTPPPPPPSIVAAPNALRTCTLGCVGVFEAFLCDCECWCAPKAVASRVFGASARTSGEGVRSSRGRLQANRSRDRSERSREGVCVYGVGEFFRLPHAGPTDRPTRATTERGEVRIHLRRTRTYCSLSAVGSETLKRTCQQPFEKNQLALSCQRFCVLLLLASWGTHVCELQLVKCRVFSFCFFFFSFFFRFVVFFDFNQIFFFLNK